MLFTTFFIVSHYNQCKKLKPILKYYPSYITVGGKAGIIALTISQS